MAKSYTKKGKGSSEGVYAVYLNIRNPLDMDAKADLSKWKKAFDDMDLDVSYLDGVQTNEDAFKALKEYLQDYGYVRWEAEELVTDLIQSNMGYDGITHIGGGRYNKKDDTRHRVYIAFEAEQIKSATDNIGTFDGKNPDIRHSTRKGETTSYTTRSLLMNADESIAIKPIQQKTLKEYRKIVEELQLEEKQLEDAQQKLEAIQDSKGLEYKRQRLELRSQIIAIRDRMSKLRKELSRYEGYEAIEGMATRERSCVVQAQPRPTSKKLTRDRQFAGVQAAKVLRKLGIGGEIYFYESYINDQGERVYRDKDGVEKPAPNGWYDRDGSIHIDLNAGKNGNGLVLFTLAHELTHFIERWSSQEYKVLADFLTQEYAKDGSLIQRILEKQEQLTQLQGKRVSYQEAYSEVIADSMEGMLTDGNVLDKLIKLKQKDMSLLMKMKQFFDNLLEKIRRVYKDVLPDSDEGKAVLAMTDDLEKIQQLFADALVEASENYWKGKTGTVGSEASVANETEIHYSRRYQKPFFKANVFPPYDESQSDTHEDAERWARSKDTKPGEKRLISHHYRWYLIQAFEDMEYGYQIVKKSLQRIMKRRQKSMKQLPDTNPYRIHLVRLVKTISMEIPMEMPDIVLIQMVLNTEEKIIKFTQWVQTKLDGGKMNATAREIVRAAVWIDDGRTDLP